MRSPVQIWLAAPKIRPSHRDGLIFIDDAGFKPSNSDVRWTSDCRRSRRRQHRNFRQRRKCKQIWPAAPSYLHHPSPHKSARFHIFSLTSTLACAIMQKLSAKHAAIAQPVERILGKDEVASSNLASSSIKNPKPFGFGFFICADRFEPLNSDVRWTSDCRRSRRRQHLNFRQRRKCKQIWLAAPLGIVAEIATSGLTPLLAMT